MTFPSVVSSPLAGHLFTVPDGTRGVDCNTPLTAETATAFYQHGYRFAVRYVPRVIQHDNDLTREEAQLILQAGLGLMLVQHVESASSWLPTHEKGTGYGAAASRQAQEMGFPAGVMLWLDLEGVAPGTTSQTITDYCNAWHTVVSIRGFLPGLYVGWHSGLTPGQLYRALRFTHYWSAYNLNADEYPAVRGVQMQQRAAHPADIPPGITFQFDVNTTRADALGSRPVIFAPEGWAA